MLKMSLSGNNSNSGRASIFETFQAPNFGGETFEASPLALATKSDSLQPLGADAVMADGSSAKSPVSVHLLSTERLSEQETMEDEYVMEEEEEESSSENTEATLWMSCSPGRDLTDDEVDENPSRDMDEMVEVCGSADEGKCSDDGDDDEDDDDLLLTEVARKQFIRYKSLPSNTKHLKSSETSRAVTDKKHIPPTRRSAYSFFFREIRSAIRSKNPDAKFHEISMIVANTWDHLANDAKQSYYQRAEEFNSHYKHQVASPAKSKSKKAKKSSLTSESEESLESSIFERVSDPRDANKHDDGDDDVDASLTCLSISSKSKLSKEETHERENTESSCTSFNCSCFKSKPVCMYTKCQNLAVDDPRWENNYCSAQCVISHCKDVFKAWVANRKTAYCGT